MSDIILGFTGTRHGMTQQQRVAFVSLLLHLQPLEFHHGGAVGADQQAHAIVINMALTGRLLAPRVHVWPARMGQQYDHERVVAYWRGRHASTVHAADPPLVRNSSIVAASTKLIATPQTAGERLRSGTWATVRRARNAKKLFAIINPDGKVVLS